LFIDCGGLKHLKIAALKNPKIMARAAEIIRQANWSPPCLGQSEDRVGVLLFLPAVKIESKMPPSTENMIPSIG